VPAPVALNEGDGVGSGSGLDSFGEDIVKDIRNDSRKDIGKDIGKGARVLLVFDVVREYVGFLVGLGVGGLQTS